MLPLSKHAGSGGEIKISPDSFIVEEITGKGTILEVGKEYSAAQIGEQSTENGKFARFVVEKSNWNTIEALRNIARKFGRGARSVGYAGMKDRAARTVQLASIFGVNADEVAKVNIRDVSINGAWQSSSEVAMGDLLGNHFKIGIHSPQNPHNAQYVVDELDGRMPNYFDRQRFGTRLNNHRIGLGIIRGDFEFAAMEFLTGTANETNQDAIEARERLKSEMDFKSAIAYFPKYLRGERTVIEYLSRYENSYSNALMKLPRGILLMFVHSVEDIIFNYSLEKHIENWSFENCAVRCGYNSYGFPDISKLDYTGHIGEGVPLANLIGYETNQDSISEYEKEALEVLGLDIGSFKLRGMGELSMKGSVRPLLTNVKDLKCNVSEGMLDVDFSLPAGSYATVMISEITKSESLLGDIPSIHDALGT